MHVAGLGRGVHGYFCVVFGWKCVKRSDGLGKERSVVCIGAGGATPPMSRQMLRQGDAPKGASPSLGVPQRSLVCLFLHCFHLLSIFGKEMGGVVGFALYRVLCLVGRCTKLHLLTFHETFPLADTFADLYAM